MVDRHRVMVRNCAVCGRDCKAISAQVAWRARPERACDNFARAAAELLSTQVSSCTEWRRRLKVARAYLQWVLWRSPTRDVPAALMRATLRFIERHARGVDPAILCAALAEHAPALDEVVRIPGGTRIPKPYFGISPRTCWVRCAEHGMWCAVGTQTALNTANSLGTRWVVGMCLIASASRSCEEFKARYSLVKNSHFAEDEGGYNIHVSRVERGKWKRNSDGERTLRYSTAGWALLAPALSPWPVIATRGLVAG